MLKWILEKDYAGLRNAVEKNPLLVNEGLPFDEKNSKKEHPLHRICDYVFSGQLKDDEAVQIGEILLEFGADVNGYEMILKKDTPLIAASSLHADGVAILYVDHHADIHHPGTHGGTALHWAAWCGRDRIVKRLIEEGADINKRCIDFLSTPLFWAVKSFRDKNDIYHQQECIRLLLDAGADKNIPNRNGDSIYDLMDEKDLYFPDR
jgi:ankyrin repeat protein